MLSKPTCHLCVMIFFLESLFSSSPARLLKAHQEWPFVNNNMLVIYLLNKAWAIAINQPPSCHVMLILGLVPKRTNPFPQLLKELKWRQNGELPYIAVCTRHEATLSSSALAESLQVVTNHQLAMIWPIIRYHSETREIELRLSGDQSKWSIHG